MSDPHIALKIAIVGAGISGLSNYLFLQKHLPPAAAHEVYIYETYPSPSRKQRKLSNEDVTVREAESVIGAGLGVAPNGMRAMKELDPEIHDAVVAQGYPILRFQLKNSRNWTLGSLPTVDVRDEEAEVTIMSMRQGVWDCLREKVPDDVLRTGKGISKVLRGETGKPILEFTDGTKSDEFDLVIGADGVKSTVKKAVTEAEPIYEGLCSLGGFFPSSQLPSLPLDLTLPAPQSPVVMTFGAEGFFGYGPCTSAPESNPQPLTSSQIDANKAIPFGPQAMWWSTFSADSPPKSTKSIDHDAVRAQLLELHSKWANPVIQNIISNNPAIAISATFTTPKLETWTADGIVLVGDAAHTLPPTSGQGVSQALEDAQSLALLLAHYLQRPLPATTKEEAWTVNARIQAAITAFQTIRKPRVESILDYSRRLSDRKKKNGFVGEWLTYLMIWVMCTFFPGLRNRPVANWDVNAEIENFVKVQERKDT